MELLCIEAKKRFSARKRALVAGCGSSDDCESLMSRFTPGVGLTSPARLAAHPRGGAGPRGPNPGLVVPGLDAEQ